jgi:hypothetical protein
MTRLSSTFTHDLKCRAFKIYRSLQRWRKPAIGHRFLFILCPPYSGSTLMHEIICSSPNVSPTNIFGTREGFGLPEVRRLVNIRKRWDETDEYPWPLIKKEWLGYWNISKPVLLDKSPANLVRAESIREHFTPASFIIMTRNPYAHCESLMRRNGMAIGEAARFSVQCLQHQRRNARRLEHHCVIRYEDLMIDPPAIKRKLEQFMPELKGLVVTRVFTAPNSKRKKLPITDFNAESIARLKPEEIFSLNREFAKEADVLAYFGYSDKLIGGVAHH